MLFLKAPTNKADLLTIVDSFLRDKFIYAPEAIESLVTPDYMLMGLENAGRLVGDCDDISMLHAALLTAMDIPVRFVAIRSTYQDPSYDHVFIEAKLDDKWLAFDITVPYGTQIEYFARFNVHV